MSKKQKLAMIKQRLEMDIKKQEYVLMKDFLKVKSQYNPAKMATAIAFQFLDKNDVELKQTEGLSLEQKIEVQERISQRGTLREMLLNALTFVDVAFSSLSDRMLHKLINDHEKYVVGKDDK
ncbi:MAG: hypothetical protein ACPG49_06325 [Chitinophagales bacterium]